jgi:hypothetical protein
MKKSELKLVLGILPVLILMGCIEEESSEKGACFVTTNQTGTMCDQRTRSECAKWPSANSSVTDWDWRSGTC